MNIYHKMSAITAELTAVAKNLQVGEGRSSYKAVGEADVLAAVKPLEEKYGVYSYPFSRNIVDSDFLTVEKTYKGEVSTTQKFFLRLETVYRFINVEQPEEYVDVTTYGDGVDANDKAPGKAMTYGDKYALLKAYKIITGEDPDQGKSEDSRITPAYRPFVAGEKFYCDCCHEEITDGVKNGGEVWPAAEIAAYTTRKFGQQLCCACAKARK